MIERKFHTAAVFFGLASIAAALIGDALWPEPPVQFMVGCFVGLLALAAAVWGATR